METLSPDSLSCPGRMVWSPAAAGAGRNAYILFVRELDLSDAVEHAVITLFADARYSLRVNGAWIAAGPGRFTPEFPRYDSWCVAGALHRGKNRIEVIVNAPGTSTFQTDPTSRGGFAAGGEVHTTRGRMSLATPGEWRCTPLSAWRGDAPAFSFAVGPVEIRDMRVLQRELAGPVTGRPVEIADGPWGLMKASEVSPPDFHLTPPAALTGPARWSKQERVLRFCVRHEPRAERGRRYALKTWVFAAQERDWEFASLWLHPCVNGHRIEGMQDAVRGNRTEYRARLNRGWNLLTGYVDALTEYWTVLFGFEQTADIELSANRERGGERAFLVAGPLDGDQTHRLATAEGAGAVAWETPDLVWKPLRLDLLGGAPARRMAWISPETLLPPVVPMRGQMLRLPVGARSGGLVVLDWGSEFLGQLHMEIDAPAGTVLDVGWGETRRTDGCVTLYPGNPMIEAADRFILAGGRQTIDGFAVRGGRYVQLIVEAPEGVEGEVIVHSIAIRSAQTPLAATGRFSCDDPLWNWVWRTGRATLEACMEDTYLDCPWRERGLYLGDAWVESRLQRVFDADPAITRRCLRLFAEGQMPGGQLHAVTPSWHKKPLADFTLTWVLFLHDHWAWTGDTQLVEELWPTVGRIFASDSWRTDAHGLWDATGLTLFIDWGVMNEWRGGRGNACLNAFRAEALRRASELAGAIGRGEEARRLASEAGAVRAAFQRDLFDEHHGRFRASLEEPHDVKHGAIHANILALAFDLATLRQREAALAFVVRSLEELAEAPLGRLEVPRVELFFLHYALELLYEADEAELADRLVRACYGVMHDAGAPTFWETLMRGHAGSGSLCHAWSGAAAYTCITQIIGLRPAVPGRTDRYVIAPVPGPLRRAECVFPHPRGEIHVSWVRDEMGVRVKVSGPPGVEFVVLEKEERLAAVAAPAVRG